ncbi:MAG: 5'/3'-nucleotidase SurE [Nitrospirae bacterium]|nr:MAG: 5'/3'-nucleotidase SurE [Nitrospirota bacterium]
MPTILVTNDDGINSDGIVALYMAMREVGDTFVVAPDREKSAVGHALTMHRPLKVEQLNDNIYTVNGTPTDCVVVAVEKLLKRRPDILISGINRGANLGDDITYSGTVSAAIEGTMFGIPSVAISMVYEEGRAIEFPTAAEFAKRLVTFLLKHPMPPDTLLNVNVPNLKEEAIRGVKFTRQGKRVYDNAIHETLDPWGRKHYWIGGGTPSWDSEDDTDIRAVTEKYISITPLHLDLTNYDALGYIKTRWQELR